MDQLTRQIATIAAGGKAGALMPPEEAERLIQAMAAHLPAAVLFAAKVLTEHRNGGEPGDIDGDRLQQVAIDCGLLEEYVVKERCGAHCCCHPGDTCCRLTSAGQALIRALHHQPL